MPLSDIADVQISAETRFPTRATFGTILVLAYTTAFLERVQTITEVADLDALGVPSWNAGYMAIQRIFAQKIRPKEVLLGRRAGAPSQSIRLTPTGVEEDWIFTVTVGGVTFSYTTQAAEAVADVTAALTRLINPDPDAILSGGASSASAQELTTFNGVLGGNTLTPPRNVTLTFDAHADWLASVATVTGLDAAGRTITESFTIPVGGGATVTGAEVFSQVTQIDIPIQGGAGGVLTAGVGDIFANANLDISATDGTTHLDIAADVVGEWFAYSGLDARLEFEDRTAEPGTTLATDLAAIKVESNAWYGVLGADAQSSAQISAIATVAETEKKFYLAHSLDSAIVKTGTGDIASVLQDAAIFRSKVFYNRRAHGQFPAAGWMGVMFGAYDPGAATWEHKEISGVSKDDTLTGTHRTQLKAKNASWYDRIKGFNGTRHSKTAAGEWMDIIRSIDWTTDNIATDVYGDIATVPKLPFTRAGLSALGGTVRNVGVRAQGKGVIDPDDPLVVVVPALADIDPADKATRILGDITFDWGVAGAIHAARIRGNVHV